MFAGVVLVDDGLYSGDTMIEVIRLLRAKDLHVSYIVTAVAREEGWDSLQAKLKSMKIRAQVFPGVVHPIKEVRDWVCERDFFYGVPYGGRTAGWLDAETPKAGLAGAHLVLGIPYCSFSTSNLKDCASLEYGAHTMARTSLQLSIDLWKEIERLNGTEFKVRELPRIPYPLHVRPEAGFVKELETMLSFVP